uniref:F-box domain-containing protein n=1 Tax=Chenopodium quinoa TaxID=63459 RepID=A0A803N197_CHEQI
MEYDAGTAMVEFGEQVLHQQKQLPDDLIRHHILPKLPIKSLIQFKLVSKQWYSTLSSHQFALFYSQLSPPFHPSSPIQFLFIQNRKNYYIFSHDDDVEVDEIDINNNKNLVKLGFDFDLELESGEELHLIGTCNGLVCLASCFGNFFVLWNPVIGKFRKYFDDELEGYLSIPFRVSWGFGYVSNVDDYKVIRII